MNMVDFTHGECYNTCIERKYSVIAGGGMSTSEWKPDRPELEGGEYESRGEVSTQSLPESLSRAFQTINKTFYSITGQAIAIKSFPSNHSFQLEEERLTNFCKVVRKSEKGLEACKFCFDEHTVFEKGRICPVKCPFGLLKMLVPIFIDGECRAFILNGQALHEESKDEFFANLPINAELLGLDYDMLYDKALELKTIRSEEMHAQGQLLLMLAEYIAYMQEELAANARYLQEFKRRVELEQEKKEIEFKFLQSQIRPHFIFNTLNILALMARKEKADTVADLIYDFSDLLRLGVKSKDSLCSVEKEIQCVSSYLNIQRIRWGSRLRTDVRLSEDAREQLIPIFSIQSLVENAVMHGMPEQGEMELNVSITIRDRQMQILVEDTGNGMEEQNLEDIRSGIHHGTGISNLMKRLRLHYGERLFFRIDSGIGRGTSVEISWAV